MKFKEIAKKVNASIVFVLLTMLGVSSLNEGYSFKVEENKEQKIIKNNNVNTPLSGSPSYYTVSSGIYALNCDGCSVVIDKDATSGEAVAYYDSNSDGVADLDTNGNKKLISNTVVDGSNTLTISTATNRSVYGFQTTVATGNYGTAGTKTLVTMLDGTISTLAGCSSASGTGLTSSFDNDFYVDMRGGSITKILSPAVWCTFNGNYNLKISGTATIVPSVNGYYMDHDGTMKATTSSVVSISGSPKIGSTVYGIKIATFDNGVANLVGDIASDAIIYVDLGSADVSGTNNLAKNTGSYTVNKTSFRVCNCSQYACTVSYNSGTSMYYFEYKEGIPEATFVQAKNTLSNLIVGGKYEVTFSDSTTETIPTLAETSYAFATTDYGKKVTQIVKKGLTAAEATAPTYTTDTSVTEQITYNFTALKQGIIYKAVFLDTTDPIYFTADDGTTTHSIVRGSNKTANQRTLSSVTTMAKADSDPQVVDFSLLNKAVLTGITFTEKEATFSGLVKGKTYDIMKAHEKFTSFTATDTSMDLSSLAAGVDPISFDALVLEGDNTTNINSDEFSLTGTIYPREPTPTSTYDAYNKGIKDLVASAGYNLIDKDGTTLGQTADATGFISIDTEFWKDSVVVKVIKQGTTGSTLDSLPQIVSYSLLPQESVAGITFTSSNASLNGLTIGKKYSLNYGVSDPTVFTATSTTLDLSTYLGGFLLGKSLVSLVCLGDYVSTIDSETLALSGTVKGSQSAPKTSFSKSSGDISGLSPNTTYTLKDAYGNLYGATSDASGVINFFNNDFVKETIVAICAVETDQYQASPYETGLYYSIMSYESASSVSYDAHNDLLTGLESGTYTLSFTDGTTIDVNGSGSIDLLGYGSGSLLNKELSTIYKHGSTYTYDSNALSLSGKILPRENTPTVNYDVLTGTFSGLLASRDYIISTSDGVKVTLTSYTNGEINMSATESLLDKSVSSFVLIGDLVKTCDSLNGASSAVAMIKKADVIKNNEKDANDLINKRIEEAIKDITDKDTINNLKQEAIDEINKLDKNQSVEDLNKEIDKIVKKLDEMVIFVYTKQVVTVDLEDMKKGCTDDKLNLIIDDGKYKVSKYDPHTSTIDDLLKAAEETKEKLQLERQANRSKEEIDDLTNKYLDDNEYRGLDNDISLLSKKYNSLIDSATTEDEVKGYVAEYEESVKELLVNNPIEKRCAVHYFTIAFDLVYIVFFIVYVFVLKHKSLDPFNFGATCGMGVISTIMTILINCSICVIFAYISWALFASGLAYILIYHFMNKKKDAKSL